MLYHIRRRYRKKVLPRVLVKAYLEGEIRYGDMQTSKQIKKQEKEEGLIMATMPKANIKKTKKKGKKKASTVASSNQFKLSSR